MSQRGPTEAPASSQQVAPPGDGEATTADGRGFERWCSSETNPFSIQSEEESEDVMETSWVRGRVGGRVGGQVGGG